jgi:hypothetical protein
MEKVIIPLAILLVMALPIFFLIKSDLKLDHEKPVTVLNWLGTNLILFSGIGLFYFLIVIFFLKRIHPSKANYFKAVSIIIILSIISVAIMIILEKFNI